MKKIINIFMFFIILFFIFAILRYYSSSTAINLKNLNRTNIDEILRDKIVDLPILENDTDNVIHFNDKFENKINGEKKRNFWDLLKK
tara:strand:- start:430 stop:690 length:261 start_codon:yes stop_codon:yes gene_type:complete